MVQSSEVLMREHYPAVAGRAIPVNAIEQTWLIEVGEEGRVGRTTPKFVNPLLKIANWLSHVGSGSIDESRLEARHNIHHNLRVNGIRL
jgi:hypothetical protein